MNRLFPYLILCAAFTPAVLPAQTTPRVERDIAYAQPKNERQLLDVYAPPTGSNLPVVVWVHGGGWMRGSKNEMDNKTEAFLAKGFVFVPVNYRFYPNVPMGTIIRDVAKSVGWVHANITRYGGDPNRIFLMGHSAGAQLVALLCTDSRYIEAEGVQRTSIKGCVPVDGDTFDVQLAVATRTARRKSLKQPAPKIGLLEQFGSPDRQREYSSVIYIAPNKGIPPFLIIHVADHTDTTAQSHLLWSALDIAGVPAKLFGADGTEHVKLNRDLGAAGDPSTQALFEFTDKLLR